MAKTKISEFNANPALNTDIDSINIAEGCAPSGINDAIRELMAQLKDWQSGTSNDPYVVGSSGSLTLNQGTANGVLYLNGSKVVTSGSALTFDGTNLGVGGTGAVPLDVYANSSALNLRLRGRSADSIGQMEFWNNAGSTRYGYISSESTAITLAGISTIPLVFVTNGSEGMRLTSTGLGIGTSSPNSSSFAKAITLNGSTSAGYEVNIAGTNMGYIGGDSGQLYLRTSGANPLTFGTSGAEKMRLDSSGNLGLGVTPSAWGTRWRVLQSGLNGGGSLRFDTQDYSTVLISNAFQNTSNQWIYSSTNGAARYEVNRLGFEWHTAASGTAGNAITFTQAATLTADGNYLVGTTSQLYGERLNATNGGSGKNAATFYFTTSDDRSAIIVRHDGASGATSRKQIAFLVSGGTEVGNIASTGSVTVYNTTSDYRLKNNQLPLINSGDFIDALKPKTWNWAKDGSKGVGFIAHEFAEVSPSSVRGEKDAVDANGNPVYQSMQASSAEVIANLVAEIQSLRQRVATLEAK